MQIAVPKEVHPGERRIPVIPTTVDKLVKRGAQISIESGLGQSIGISDEDYTKVGAKIIQDRKELISNAGVVPR